VLPAWPQECAGSETELREFAVRLAKIRPASRPASFSDARGAIATSHTIDPVE
jgi:hypothetical protein